MNFSKIRDVIEQEEIFFSYSGIISQSLTTSIEEITNLQLADRNEDKKIARYIFLISVEQLQNMMSYSVGRKTLEGNRYSTPGIFVLGYNKNIKKYFVSSSNEIEKKEIEGISSKIDYINSLDKMQLKEFLKEKLRTSEDSHERGAGIGFIEMAKRSSEKIEYNFEYYGEKIFFNILIYL